MEAVIVIVISAHPIAPFVIVDLLLELEHDRARARAERWCKCFDHALVKCFDHALVVFVDHSWRHLLRYLLG
jgi:hypothetical protein